MEPVLSVVACDVHLWHAPLPIKSVQNATSQDSHTPFWTDTRAHTPTWQVLESARGTRGARWECGCSACRERGSPVARVASVALRSSACMNMRVLYDQWRLRGWSWLFFRPLCSAGDDYSMSLCTTGDKHDNLWRLKRNLLKFKGAHHTTVSEQNGGVAEHTERGGGGGRGGQNVHHGNAIVLQNSKKKLNKWSRLSVLW